MSCHRAGHFFWERFFLRNVFWETNWQSFTVQFLLNLTFATPGKEPEKLVYVGRIFSKNYFWEIGWQSCSVQFFLHLNFSNSGTGTGKNLLLFFKRLFLRNRLAKLQCAVLQNSTFQTPEKEQEKTYLWYFQRLFLEKLQCAVFAKLYFSNSGTGTGKNLLLFFKRLFLEKLQCAVFANSTFQTPEKEQEKTYYCFSKDYFWETGWQSYSVQFCKTLLFKLRKKNRKKPIYLWYFQRLFLEKLQCAVFANSTFQTPEKEPEKTYLRYFQRLFSRNRLEKLVCSSFCCPT